MTNIKDVIVNGVNYRIDENFFAVKDSIPLKSGVSALNDGNEYFSIVRKELAALQFGTKYPVVRHDFQQGVLTGKIVVTLDREADPKDTKRALEKLGYRQIGGRGRAILLQRSSTDILDVVEDVEHLTSVEGVAKASPQILFPKAYR